MTKKSKRAVNKPTEAARTRFNSPRTRKTMVAQTLSASSKMTKAELAREALNRRMRKAYCIVCKSEREKSTYPICGSCSKRKKDDKIITRRDYCGW